MKAIVYESKTGFTERYALFLAKKSGLQVFTLKEAIKKLTISDEVIFFGWVFAGILSGFTKAKKRFKIIACVGVGMTESSPNYIDVLKTQNHITDLPFFFFRGGMLPNKINGISKIILRILTSSLKKSLSKQADESKRIEISSSLDILQNGGDFVDESLVDDLLIYAGVVS